MSLVNVVDVEDRFATGLDSGVLQDIITEQETWLASKIGPLTGARTLTVYPNQHREPLYLPRETDSVVVRDGGFDVDPSYILFAGSKVRKILPTSRAARQSWYGPVELTFTPTDEANVRRVVIELCRLAVTASPYNSEATEGRSYVRSAAYERERQMQARSLQPNRGPKTLVIK